MARTVDAVALLGAARAEARRGATATLLPAVTDAATSPGPTSDDALVEEQGPDPADPTDADDRPAPTALDGLEATGERRRRRKRSTARNAAEWALVLVGALVVAFVVKTFLFQAFYIPSSSMEPALQIGDRVLVNKVGYDVGDVERGDIIVFERPDTWGAGEIADLIKRVVGLPGDVISVADGHVLVNGERAEEGYLADGVQTPAFFPESGCVPSCVIPEDHLFVLGDNRTNSDASNHFGPLPFDDVVGRAFVRVWPLGEVGSL